MDSADAATEQPWLTLGQLGLGGLVCVRIVGGARGCLVRLMVHVPTNVDGLGGERGGVF